ncbi:hypothetical protein [Sinorhizobium medicae]|uniref:hypothetical protein n=1 Tax=Sinorhizobium medicae TaxID=110321 RepID=UPI00040AF539|nr:hypothetical protein [Sinorhizobium medicae]WQO56760.1 hypothetical protein U8C36_32300 [Sinorhizobium medicae]
MVTAAIVHRNLCSKVRRVRRFSQSSTTRRRQAALAGAEIPHSCGTKVKARADIVRSAASFIVLPFDGGSDFVAALPVDPNNYGDNDGEGGRSRDEARRGEHYSIPSTCFATAFRSAFLRQKAGDPYERDKDQ